jgi:hypothetical protein
MPVMDARELRERAEQYRRASRLVTDKDAAKGMLEVAELYEARARALAREQVPPEEPQD